MTRTVDAIALDALANQKGEAIIRVLTWLDLAAYNAAPSIPTRTWECEAFDINSTSAKASIITDNDYTYSDFTVFIIERGVKFSGTEYPIQSGLYFITSFIEDAGRVKIEGSSYPNSKITLAGDDTYENVITAFCTAIGKTAVFKDPAATWLNYQFLPAGKQVILNKAERFESLIKQKYTILCYERSPLEMVFYVTANEQAEWKDITYANSQFVIVAESGQQKAATSTDGAAWTKQTAPSYSNAIAYSPTLDLFAAVGASTCITSPDGITWTSRAIGTGTWTDISWNATLSKFIAVSNGRTATSTDGITWIVTSQLSYDHTWDSQTAAEANAWTGICWSPELSLFVAVGWIASNSVMTSPDGINWTARATPVSTPNPYIWNGVCWSPELSLFAAVAGSEVNAVMTSPDGINWTAKSLTVSSWQSVCWSPELSLFVAVGPNNSVMTSSDGDTWTISSGSTIGCEWTDICWSPELSLFVAVATNGHGVMTSPDGTTWTARTPAAANLWYSVCWSPELSLFVAASGDGTQRVMTSPDGINWTSRTTPGASIWGSVCWSSELSLFIAVSPSSTRIMSSPDGINWTARTEAETNRWTAVCWSPDLFLFVAVSDDGTHRVMTSDAVSTFTANAIQDLVAVGPSAAYTSTNATTWTTQTIPAGTYNALTTDGSIYVAVGASACATSPDGATWTARTIPAGTYYGVDYSSTLSLFVAVGNGIVSTSPDGITWTTRTPPAANIWKSVKWSDTLGLFITVASSGESRIASSVDGINWTILTTQADFSLDYQEGVTSNIVHGTSEIHYLWRDETAAINTEGDTDKPQWNLGYLESTATPPATRSDPFYKFYLKKAPIRLDITDGDRIHFSPYWTLDPTLPIDASAIVTEHFNISKSPSWWQEIKSLTLFDGTEGGALPSTIERVAAYTPLVSSGFDGNLSPSVNNLQALAQAVDDLFIGGSGPITTAANDFQVGDGAGSWITKTLAQAKTILGIIADAASDSVYYVRRNATWTNLKTYTDTLYAALSHSHAASDVTSGTMATARLGSGSASSSTYLRGDQTWDTPAGGGGSDPLSIQVFS